MAKTVGGRLSEIEKGLTLSDPILLAHHRPDHKGKNRRPSQGNTTSPKGMDHSQDNWLSVRKYRNSTGSMYKVVLPDSSVGVTQWLGKFVVTHL